LFEKKGIHKVVDILESYGIESVIDTNGKQTVTGGTLTEVTVSPTKLKITMTTEQQTFTQKFKTPPSKVDKTRKITQRHVRYRGVSMKRMEGEGEM
jgi:hypothetical protein